MYFWKKENDMVWVECDKCGKFLKFEQKYFRDINGTDYCETNVPIKCSCGNISNGIIKAKEKNEKSEFDKIKAINNVNTPHCPICGSTNIEKISGANKVGKIVLLGVFSLGSIGKTFKCKNCGMKF